ncbi:MAG: glycosyltransferase [Actinomycetota bacterium]
MSRLLFVSSVTDGGSGRSQRELAAALIDAGRDVRILASPTGTTRAPRRVRLMVAGAGISGTGTQRPLAALRRRLGTSIDRRELDGVPYDLTPVPEVAFETVTSARRPDAVIVSSIERHAWRSIRAACRRRGIPTALHLREPTAIGHLSAGLRPDLLLANSGTLVEDAARLGHHATLVPSVVTAVPMDRPPTGEVLLMINPVASHGVDLVGPIAAARPDIPIVLQESRALSRGERDTVERIVARHPNVTSRAFDPRRELVFRDARVLLAPHRVDNRPRTVLEAQANGIPVVSSDRPGLVESAGDGGVIVAERAGADAWIRAVGALWDDEGVWMAASDRARIHAGRPDVRPARVAERFGELIDELVDAGQNNSMSPSENRN